MPMSLSDTVAVPWALTSKAPLVGLLRLKWKISVCSKTPSSTVVIVIVFSVSAAVNVAVPLAVTKSLPAIAELFAAVQLTE